MFQIKTGDELNFLDEREAIESNTSHLVVGGALGARQMHLTPQHGRKSVCHSVSFHYTTSFLVSQQTEFGFPVPDDVSLGSRQDSWVKESLEAAGLCCPLTVIFLQVPSRVRKARPGATFGGEP